jgi:hypothetical protein
MRRDRPPLRNAPPMTRVALLIAAELLGCTGGGTAASNVNQGRSQTASVVPVVTAPADSIATATSLARPSIGSRVFVDVSAGMRGFAASNLRKAPLKTLHRLIDVAAGEAGAAEVKRCALGSMVVCVKEPDAGVRCHNTAPITCYEKHAPDWSSAALYSARSSKLEAVLVPAPVSTRYDADHAPPPDPIDAAGLTVLVTGSIVPDAVATGAGRSSAEACRAGPSPQCVTSALAERVKNGYGVWLISVLLDYDGAYVADVPLDKRYLAAATEHLLTIKSVTAGATSKFAGIEFKVGPQSSVPDGDPAFSSFRYAGVRPVLLFVLSRDVDQGRRFVAQLTQRFRDDVTLRPGKMLPEDVVHSLELAPLTPSTYRLGSPQLGPDQGALDPGALSEFRIGQSQLDADGTAIDLSCGGKGKGWIRAPYTVTTADVALASPMTQSAALRGPLVDRLPSPPQLGAFEAVPEQPAFRVFTNCAALGVRKAPWSIEYGLRRKLLIDRAAIASTWWAQLSSPNSYVMPERIYGLSSIALALLELRAEKDEAMGRIKINVSRIE